MSGLDLSVVIPTFCREQEVVEAARSALAIAGPALEVLVVDDSPDGSAARAIAAIGDPRLRYVRTEAPGGGPARARNFGARATSGRILYFLDDDDHALPAALAAACAQLQASDAGVLIGAVEPFGADAARVAEERRYWARTQALFARERSRYTVVAKLLFSDALLVCSSCLVKRGVFEALGGFDPDVLACEDVEFFQRATRRAGYLRHPTPVLERRIGHAARAAKHGAEKRGRAYRLAHAKYRRTHGWLEFTALRVWSRLAR